jgi:aminoglycoside phosphotransferase (APT) family kinase protein
LRCGEPNQSYPWRWSIVPFIKGDSAHRAPLRDPAAAASILGHFLRALHQPSPADAPHNPYRGAPLADRAVITEERFDKLTDELPDIDALRRVWEDGLKAPVFAGPPVWLHGDLHPANILVHEGALAGVVDFGDICTGDPATDLLSAWLLLPASARPLAFDAYGGVDSALDRRTRGWVVSYGLVLLEIGLTGLPYHEPIARAALQEITRS